ncbi:IS3 family transposase, partial [Rhodobacteraceae bacterium 2CG4]|nr:IS3 family transposase [Halovulum marinum]
MLASADVEKDRMRENPTLLEASFVSPAKKKSMIRRDHPELSISQQCRLVKLSRSAFYYAPVGVDAATLA